MEALADARHGGSSGAVGPQDGTIRWRRALGSPISGGPAVAPDGTVYVASDAGVLFALDPSSGREEWRFRGGSPVGGDDLSTTPAVLPDGTVLWPGSGGKLFAISPAGALRWTLPLRGTVLSPVIGQHGRVYVSDSDGDLVALTPTTTAAHVAWRTALGGSSLGSPAIGPSGAVYVTTGRDLVAVRDRGTEGVVLWRFAAGATVEVSPSVGPDGIVVLGTNDPYEYGISPAGKVVWRVQRQEFSFSTPAVTPDGLAYYGDNSGYVDAVRVASGATVGRYGGAAQARSPKGIGVWTAPLVDAHHDVYFGTASGHIFGYTYGGRELFDLATGATVDSYPALGAGGTLLIGSDDGTLYAIGG